jgi:hypothetical protein
VYRRADTQKDRCTIRLNGLDPQKTYRVYNYDAPEGAAVYTGEALMDSGLELVIPEAPKAVILLYAQQP